MKKNLRQKAIWFMIPLFFGAMFMERDVFLRQAMYGGLSISAAHADDGEDGEGQGDDGFVPSSSSSSQTTSTKTKSIPTYKTVLVTKVITTLDPIFTTDTDRDKIVDGLDPHPTISESEYFTDDDNDGVPNAFDLHPGEDDYAYFEQDQDTNGNGILDSYESLADSSL